MVHELEQNKTGAKTDDCTEGIRPSTSPRARSTRYVSAAPPLHVDDKDGVVDVEIDLPGFMGVSHLSPPQSHSSKPWKRGTSFSFDGSDSICSLGSIASKTGKGAEDDHINVGGYLKRHHEDFTLHAVRPYNELIGDIERSMRSEPTPREVMEQNLHEARAQCWITVCTTLVADTKSFTIRRLKLRRQYQVRSPGSAGSRDALPASSTNSASLSFLRDEFTNETVMEFDTTLTDAIEKVLHVGTSVSSRSATTSRSHSRNVSISSNQVEPFSAASKGALQGFTPRTETAKAGRRDLVVSALEDVVRSVNEDLSKKSQEY